MSLSPDGEETHKRGAAGAVFLHFVSFSQLSIHRTCLQLLDAADDDQRYEQLVRREAQRRGVEEQSAASFYQRPLFSATLVDAAYRSVVNATSRAGSTHEVEFRRLQR